MNKLFSHEDYDGDRIRVERIAEGEAQFGKRFLVRADGGDGDQVQVVLSGDDALRLANAVLSEMEAGK